MDAAELRVSGLPLPRARLALVGRHRLHLRRNEPLPVGGARDPVARRPRAWSDDPGREAERAGARVVERSPLGELAAPHARREPGDPRPPRADRRLLAPALIQDQTAGKPAGGSTLLLAGVVIASEPRTSAGPAGPAGP